MLASRILALQRLQKCTKYRTNPVFNRAMSHREGGTPGENLPFRKLIGNPARCTWVFILWFGSGLWVPCVAFVYLMHKD
ncbi:unnamed protein product [Ceutorhynchus assimilis]|uniref:Cytochrome c oxidase polypeptide VIIc n=1 Tax=Ceutorhynchus assimilis TaxID=467358 RepID=A0A9N9MLI3_9CUCU|nr:unnamed protein product [Ceutorhynchus assimilis]